MILTFLLLWALAIFGAFWVIRLAVRYGMNDALRMNRGWLVLDRDQSRSARERAFSVATELPPTSPTHVSMYDTRADRTTLASSPGSGPWMTLLLSAGAVGIAVVLVLWYGTYLGS